MLGSEITQKLTLHARKSLKDAEEIAAFYQSEEIRPIHLFYAIYLKRGSLGSSIIKNSGVEEGSIKKVISPDGFPDSINKKISTKAKPKRTTKISIELKLIIIKSYNLAGSFNYPYVGTEHLVYTLLESGNPEIKKILETAKIKKLPDGLLPIQPNSANGSFSNISRMFNIPEIALSQRNKKNPSPTPHLDQFCLDLNQDSRERKELVIGRNSEIERISNILGRKTKNNPILIGDPGVGKTAIVVGIAQKINLREVSPTFQNKRILQLDMALLVAGTSYRGEFEARLKEIIREATLAKNVILFIDEIHSIVGTGNASGGLDAANILKPALSRGDIQCIGATTIEEYKRHIEKDPALERRLQPVLISEPGIRDTKKIILGIKESYEKFHNTSISEKAVNLAVELSSRYILDRYLPDKAIDVIDETASRMRNQHRVDDFYPEIKKVEEELEKISNEKNELVKEEQYEKAIRLREREKSLSTKIEDLKEKRKNIEMKNPTEIVGKDIALTISHMTGIPLEKLEKKGLERIKNLESKLSAQIFGQTEAVKKISDVIKRSQSGISSPDKPLGSFLFLGPTGVGKTFTAKILAEILFESPKSLIRIDMSEFMERHNVSKLIGAPAGYVGYGEGGKLTEAIRRKPYSVVLFDEIEKAHPDIFNILLQILEDGILTDAEGKTVNFKNTVIILTSNLGNEEFISRTKIGFRRSEENALNSDFEPIKSRVLAELKKNLRIELINRLDHITIFNPLRKSELGRVAEAEFQKLKNRLLEQEYALEYHPQVIEFISRKSLSPEQGARLVRKNFQEMIENDIAQLIVDGKVKDNTINVRIKDGKIKIA